VLHLLEIWVTKAADKRKGQTLHANFSWHRLGPRSSYMSDRRSDRHVRSVIATQLVCRRRRVWRGAFNILSSYLHFVRGP